ncbi:molybdopterin molybdenumtransferase [Actinopolyspora mortivallis]|uniref:Molybdopterin molybdenumtransferase n=1 Tax=Actinopolyspora mortivallis TaxID=33906 RepID=A0A2T0GX14_ACTMO|nr:molybdopterin molybdenumtransferase [Actinopolyspora mortivallis]
MSDDRGVAHDTDTSALLSVEDYARHVSELLSPTPVRNLPLEDCLGLALAEPVTTGIPLPPFDNSAMDGYAVRAADLEGATGERPVTLPVTDDVPAGRVEVAELSPGTAQRIMTGAQLPPGADATVAVEHTDGGTERVAVRTTVSPGANVRRAGEDVSEGDTVLHRGDTLGAARLGMAAAVGRAELPVHRPVRVLVLSTGSELVEPGEPLERGQIHESNGTMLAAAVRQCGGETRLLRFVPDDTDAFHAALEPHLEWTDLILTSGGVSAGAYEVVKDALEHSEVRFHRVAIQPGMPQGAGHYTSGGHRIPVITLPGNPVSSIVSFEVFVRPALRQAGGHHRTHRPFRWARLTGRLRSSPGKRQYRRGTFDPASDSVTVPGGAGSHLLSGMAEADCLVELPEDSTEVAEGTTVRVWLLD